MAETDTKSCSGSGHVLSESANKNQDSVELISNSNISDEIDGKVNPDKDMKENEFLETNSGELETESTPSPVVYKLHDAVNAFNVPEVNRLLNLGYDVNEKNENCRNAVYTMLSKYVTLTMVEQIHAKPQFIEILSMLARNGLDINSGDYSKQTALHFIAAQGNYVDIIKPLLAAGCKVNSQNAKLQTPLHAAILKGHAANAQVLVEGGADTDIRDRSGEAALHMLCKGKRKLKLIQLLLRCGANVNVRDSGGRTPLHVATKYSRLEHVHELISNGGAKVNARDASGQTPLHYAMKFDMTGAIVAELLDGRADINMADSIGDETPLHKTITYGTVESFKLLIQNRIPPNPNAKDMLGETPLHRAAKCQDIFVWKELLKLGGDVTVINESGFTPVQKALRVKNAVALSLLREHGAYVSSY